MAMNAIAGEDVKIDFGKTGRPGRRHRAGREDWRDADAWLPQRRELPYDARDRLCNFLEPQPQKAVDER